MRKFLAGLLVVLVLGGACFADNTDTWTTFAEGELIDFAETNPLFLHITGDLLPRESISDIGLRSTREVYDLGDATYPWRFLYVSSFESIVFPSVSRYYSFNASQVQTQTNEADYDRTAGRFRRDTTASTVNQYYIPISLPHGVAITQLDGYVFRDDAASSITFGLARTNHSGTSAIMAQTSSTTTEGIQVITDSTITAETIDNENYSYAAFLSMDNNDSINDTLFYSGRISYEVTGYLP